MYESGRKCNELIGRLSDKLGIAGWRQWKDNKKKLKSAYRNFGRITSKGGQNKKQREQKACNELLEKGRQLLEKSLLFKEVAYRKSDSVTISFLVEIEWFISMLSKHIDLLERRIIKGETIPHEEKIFSIFQPYTEWINKGKTNVEIGKKIFITTDQYHLITDYMIGEELQDKEAFVEVVSKVMTQCKLMIKSWSFDKGFSSKEDKELFEAVHPENQLIMSKKGKKNQQEEEVEKE